MGGAGGAYIWNSDLPGILKSLISYIRSDGLLNFQETLLNTYVGLNTAHGTELPNTSCVTAHI